ncbi:hypothetical protein [Saccharomonospora cyanea]|uniref:hypothetical protein n=1 Tax=Saccharomonospora cyanea TaxID=40989 RepID=UPI001E450FFA|nr:hypothetical protein [Saccharomonospora cyanea]
MRRRKSRPATPAKRPLPAPPHATPPGNEGRRLPNGVALGAALAGVLGYVGARLLNQAIEAPVPLDTLGLTEIVPLVLTALVVLLRPFRTERTRFWGAFTLGVLLPAVITARWVPYDNLLSPPDTVLVFCGHALAPLALLAVADIAIARHTTGEPLGGTAQFALPLATWVAGFHIQLETEVSASGTSLIFLTPITAVLLFVLLSSVSGRDLLDRFGLVIGIGASVLPVALYLLLGAPLNEPLVYLQGLPVATFAIPFVLVRRFTARRTARRTAPRVDTRDLLR